MSTDETPGSAPSSPRQKRSDAIADDFHAATGLPPTGGRPVIRWVAGELPRVVDEAEAAIMRYTDEILFQRGPMVVRVVKTAALTARNFTRHAGSLGIVPVDKTHLTELMTRAAVWEKYDGRSEVWRTTNAPETVAQTYLARSGQWKLPHLVSVISAPTLRPDGSLLQDPGYDRQTGTWYDPCGIEFPRVEPKPTQKAALAALDKLLTAIDSLPFFEKADTSVALALMLTALVRRSLPTAPLGAITAPTPSSGKTLLADCLSILAAGVKVPAMSYAAKDEEAEKTALTVLMGGDPVVLIDNIERPLGGAWLCTILTSDTYQGRALGRNEMVRVPTTTLFLATGNKLVIQGDLRTRALLCRIDPKSERPDHRKFDVDLKDVFLDRRVELVAAGLTVIRAYLHGREPASVFRPWGRFERWSQFCREPLMWLGLTDPCDSYSAIEADDPDRQDHVQMLAAWVGAFGDRAVTAREAIRLAVSGGNEGLQDVLADIAKERGGTSVSPKRLGRWLHAHEGRIAQGRKFERAGEQQGSALWRVVDAKP